MILDKSLLNRAPKSMLSEGQIEKLPFLMYEFLHMNCETNITICLLSLFNIYLLLFLSFNVFSSACTRKTTDTRLSSIHGIKSSLYTIAESDNSGLSRVFIYKYIY